MAMRIADKIVSIANKLNIPYVFKGSFKKANRSRIDSFTGIGDEKALKILHKVGKEFGVPTVTDIHEINDAPWQQRPGRGIPVGSCRAAARRKNRLAGHPGRGLSQVGASPVAGYPIGDLAAQSEHEPMGCPAKGACGPCS